jgi:hypothetical protein
MFYRYVPLLFKNLISEKVRASFNFVFLIQNKFPRVVTGEYE